jgi:hypothetical protein
MTSEADLLDPGEQLIWSGAPNALSFAFRRSWSTFLFGIFFFGFSVFWVHGAATQGGSGNMPGGFSFWMFGIPFVAIGAGMVLSPVWQFLRGLRATYVLTNQRAVVAFAGPFPRRISMPLGQIGFVDVRPATDGSGDIYFKETVVSGGDGRSVRRDGFVAIGEVANVERLLRAAVGKAVASGRPA